MITHQHEPPDQQRSLLWGPASARLEWLLLGAVLIAIGLFGFWGRYDAYQAVDAEQRHLLDVQSTAVEENLARQLAGAAAALRGVRADIDAWPADELATRTSRRFRALSEAMPGLRAMQFLDRDGRVVGSSVPDFVGLDFSESDYFAEARALPDRQRLDLSAPFLSAPGAFSMNLTIAVVGGDGSFGGIVTATLDPDYFRTALHSAQYAPDAWASVVHGDGRVMMVEPSDGKLVGLNANREGSFFKRHTDSGRHASVLTGTIFVTGEPRMMSLRTLRPQGLSLNKPIVVAVSRNLDAIFAPWWRQTWIDVLLYGLLGAATSFSLLAMQRRQRAIDQLQLQKVESDRRSAERLELALEGADLGLWDVNVQTGATIVSERVDSMLGLPHHGGYPDSQAWSSRVHPDDWERVREAKKAHLEGHTERFDQTYRLRHADGHWVWVLDRSQMLERDAQGRPLRMVGTHMDVTERMEAQLALERSEQSLATTLYSIGDAVVATDPQGRIVRMNATAERLTGWHVVEAMGQPLASVFHIVNARSRAPSVDPVQKVIECGEVIGLANDTLLISRDGREYQISDSAAPIRAPDGEITGVVLVFSDVTERYRVQQALRANEERLRESEDLKASVLDSLNAHIAVVDRHGVIVAVNEAWRRFGRVHGAPADVVEPVGVSYLGVCSEAGAAPSNGEAAPALEGIRSVLAGEQGEFHLEYPCHSEHETSWFRMSVTPIRGSRGGAVISHMPVTELKQAEQSISAARGELQATLEAVPDLLFELDRDGRFHNFHSPRRELLYVPPGEFIGRTVSQVLPREVADVIRRAIAQTDAFGFSAGLQYELPLPDGPHWFELSVARKPMPAGEMPRFIALARDVTERQQSEQQRQALESQLREAQKMESIGTLAGGIAHDFNNILAAILGNVALAREDVAAGHSVIASLDQINRAGLRARQLVQQILTFSRREHRVFSLQPLAPVVQETVEMLRATLPAGVRLDVVVPDAPMAVLGDSTQLQQVLLNLCTNAWQALPDPGGRIEVGFERQSLDETQRLRVPDLPPGDCVHLWVRDNGSGMDEATRLRIFDPFFTTKKVGRGTGLGLSVVHGIVRAHHGVIALDTAPGQGTTFHLYLPLPEVSAAEPPAEPAAAAVPCGDGQHVLYIDDDEVMVVMVERLLQRAGFRVTVETDANAALLHLRAQPAAFDAVVTDFNMPEVSGLDVASQIACIRPELPVVMSSGLLTDVLKEQAEEVGVRALIHKENTFEELVALLQRLLASQPDRGPPSSCAAIHDTR